MGIFNITESERAQILNLHSNAKIIKEQAAAPSAEDIIKQIQTALNTKYGAKLTVDGKWGNLTQAAYDTAIKTKSTSPKAPVSPSNVVASGTTRTVIPGIPDAPNPTVSGTTAPVTPATPAAPVAPVTPTTPAEPVAPEELIGMPAPEPQLNQASQQALSGQLTPQQIRQQARFDQRLARQARRTARRAGQQ